MKPDKSLGQHWLHDKTVLATIADEADIQATDTVLEIGPGLGTLTKLLCERAQQVIAVEFDTRLADQLSITALKHPNLTVVQGDILKFDLTVLPKDYKVVANVPYYITSKIVHLLLTSSNTPQVTTLLVQKEVAERIAASPGQMSLLSLSSQLFATCRLGPVVPAALFTPPPKVDSQVVTLVRRSKPQFNDITEKEMFTVAKAGFAERRKKLRSSLSGGLHLDKTMVDEILQIAGLNEGIRAQELSLEEWGRLVKAYKKLK